MDKIAKKLHEWYLEAITSGLAGEQHNSNTVKKYDDLTDEQKAIDLYIADKIKQTYLTEEEMGDIIRENRLLQNKYCNIVISFKDYEKHLDSLAKAIYKAQENKRWNI